MPPKPRSFNAYRLPNAKGWRVNFYHPIEKKQRGRGLGTDNEQEAAFLTSQLRKICNDPALWNPQNPQLAWFDLRVRKAFFDDSLPFLPHTLLLLFGSGIPLLETIHSLLDGFASIIVDENKKKQKEMKAAIESVISMVVESKATLKNLANSKEFKPEFVYEELDRIRRLHTITSSSKINLLNRGTFKQSESAWNGFRTAINNSFQLFDTYLYPAISDTISFCASPGIRVAGSFTLDTLERLEIFQALNKVLATIKPEDHLAFIKQFGQSIKERYPHIKWEEGTPEIDVTSLGGRIMVDVTIKQSEDKPRRAP